MQTVHNKLCHAIFKQINLFLSAEIWHVSFLYDWQICIALRLLVCSFENVVMHMELLNAVQIHETI